MGVRKFMSETISVEDVPERGERYGDLGQMLFDWFPEPLSQVERKTLQERGAQKRTLYNISGWYIQRSQGLGNPIDLYWEAIGDISEAPRKPYMKVLPVKE